MRRFQVSLSLLLALTATSQSSALDCELLFLRLIHSPRVNEPYDLASFRQQLANKFFSSWKQKLIYELWKGEVERGYNLVNLSHYDSDTNPWLPYALAVPRDLADTLFAALKSKGLSPGERFVTIPAKALLTEGIRKFWGNLFLGLSLGAGGKILNSMGVLTSDPLIDETDPSSVKSDEVILLVKMGDKKDGKEEAGKWAMKIAATQMEYLKSQNPDKFVILDLSNDGGASPLEQRVQETLANLNKRHINVRKIIGSGHGSPGYVVNDKIGSRSLEQFAKLLLPLKPRLSKKPEVYFDSCMLAGNDSGREQVDKFGDVLLPTGGSVTANRIVSVAGFGSPDGLKKTSSGYQKAVTAINPIAGETVGFATQAYGILGSRVGTFLFRNDYNNDPFLYLKPATYHHLVGGAATSAP